MIKINKDSPEVTDAEKAHWEWVRLNFKIKEPQPPQTASREDKGVFTKSVNRKKRLYELLGFITEEQKKDKTYFAEDKDQEFEDLIRVKPSQLKMIRDSSKFKNLVVEESDQLKEYLKKKKDLKNDPNNETLKEEVNALEGVVDDDLDEYNKKKELSDEIQQLLGYEKLYDKDSQWNAYKLCDSLKLTVCPYCNRQYIFTAKNEEGKWKCRPQLDHFYVKSKYPFLSCSFYNLIPSCPFCNEGKNDCDKDTIYPYLEEFGNNAVFRMDGDEIKIVKTEQKNFIPKARYKISLENFFSENENAKDLVQGHKIREYEQLVENSNDVFHLEILYNGHQLELKNLLVKYAAVLGVNLEKYAEIYYEEKNVSEEKKESLKKILLGLPLFFDDGDDYPLRKFKTDIINQLDDV